MADQVLCSGVACITDLMAQRAPRRSRLRGRLLNHERNGHSDDWDRRSDGEQRALRAAKAAIANPLLATPITPPKRFAVERSHAIASSSADRLSKGRGFPNPCGGVIYSA